MKQVILGIQITRFLILFFSVKIEKYSYVDKLSLD